MKIKKMAKLLGWTEEMLVYRMKEIGLIVFDPNTKNGIPTPFGQQNSKYNTWKLKEHFDLQIKKLHWNAEKIFNLLSSESL